MKTTDFDRFEAALVDALQSPAADASEAAKQRVQQRLGLSLAAGAVGLSVTAASSAMGAASPSLPSLPLVAAAPALGGKAAGILSVHGVSVLAALLAGGAIGTAATLTWSRVGTVEVSATTRQPTARALPPVALVSPPTARIEPKLANSAPTAVEAAPAVPSSSAESRRTTPTPEPSQAVPRAATEAANVEDDGALLERARAALAQSDSARALSYLSLHERTFPRSPLLEEREALAIKALVAASRIGEARLRLGTFATRYPKSLFLMSLRAAVETNP